MRIDGGSTRRRTAYRVIAAGAALLIVARTERVAAIAADARPADTAVAAALYEPDIAAASSASKSTSASVKLATATTSAAASSDSSTDDDFAPAPSKSLPQPVTTETVIVPASMPAPTYVKQDAAMPPSTIEIPQYAAGPQPGTAEIESSTAPDAQGADYAARHPEQIDPKLRSLQEFMDEDDQISPLGMQLREDQRKLNSGETATGLLVVAIQQHSAAAIAGLAVAAALFFPPAVLAIPIAEQVSLGESYDLIIGVDGTRVTNYLDFEDRLRDIQPGEIVYLSIVRNGNRVQVPVHVQALPQSIF